MEWELDITRLWLLVREEEREGERKHKGPTDGKFGNRKRAETF